MSEVIQAIFTLLERYMRRKSADIVMCVIISTIAIAFFTGIIVPICISTLGCQILYGVIIAIIVLATIGFLIKILKSEHNYGCPGNQQNYGCPGNQNQSSPNPRTIGMEVDVRNRANYVQRNSIDMNGGATDTIGMKITATGNTVVESEGPIRINK